MANVQLHTLKCITPEDHGSNGDEAYIEVKINGQRKLVWGPRQMRAGDQVELQGLSFPAANLTIYLWDRDNGQGALIDPDDPLGRHVVKTKPGQHTAKFTDDGAEYYLTYTVSA